MLLVDLLGSSRAGIDLIGRWKVALTVVFI